jgi:hypothetical protein
MTKIDESNDGKRVKLIYTNDPYTKLKPGDLGIYQMLIINPPPIGIQHCINWDNGSNLGLVSSDRFEFVDHQWCKDCGFALELTYPDTPGGPTDGVICSSEKVAEQMNSLEEFKSEGKLQFWRGEIISKGPDGKPHFECPHWKKQTPEQTKQFKDKYGDLNAK